MIYTGSLREYEARRKPEPVARPVSAPKDSE